MLTYVAMASTRHHPHSSMRTEPRLSHLNFSPSCAIWSKGISRGDYQEDVGWFCMSLHEVHRISRQLILVNEDLV